MPRKSMKAMFIESVMFISIFVLISHLSVNLWERYVIQKELVKMKSSLYTLKDTVNNIGVAYDHLHDELKTLVVFAENPYTSERESLEKKSLSYQERKTFLDSYMQSSFQQDEKEVNVKPSTRNVSEQISSLFKIIPKLYKNATTLKTPLIRNVNIQKCDHHSPMSCMPRISKVDKYVEIAFPLEDKYVQYPPRSHSKIVAEKDAAPRTKYPQKFTGAKAKAEYPIHNPKIRPGCVGRSGRCSFSRYHEKCAPDYYHR